MSESESVTPLRRWLNDKDRGAQADLARAVGVTSTFISECANGRGRFSKAVAERVVAHTGLALDDLPYVDTKINDPAST